MEEVLNKLLEEVNGFINSLNNDIRKLGEKFQGFKPNIENSIGEVYDNLNKVIKDIQSVSDFAYPKGISNALNAFSTMRSDMFLTPEDISQLPTERPIVRRKVKVTDENGNERYEMRDVELPSRQEGALKLQSMLKSLNQFAGITPNDMDSKINNMMNNYVRGISQLQQSVRQSLQEWILPPSRRTQLAEQEYGKNIPGIDLSNIIKRNELYQKYRVGSDEIRSLMDRIGQPPGRSFNEENLKRYLETYKQERIGSSKGLEQILSTVNDLAILNKQRQYTEPGSEQAGMIQDLSSVIERDFSRGINSSMVQFKRNIENIFNDVWKTGQKEVTPSKLFYDSMYEMNKKNIPGYEKSGFMEMRNLNALRNLFSPQSITRVALGNQEISGTAFKSFINDINRSILDIMRNVSNATPYDATRDLETQSKIINSIGDVISSKLKVNEQALQKTTPESPEYKKLTQEKESLTNALNKINAISEQLRKPQFKEPTYRELLPSDTLIRNTFAGRYMDIDGTKTRVSPTPIDRELTNMSRSIINAQRESINVLKNMEQTKGLVGTSGGQKEVYPYRGLKTAYDDISSTVLRSQADDFAKYSRYQRLQGLNDYLYTRSSKTGGSDFIQKMLDQTERELSSMNEISSNNLRKSMSKFIQNFSRNLESGFSTLGGEKGDSIKSSYEKIMKDIVDNINKSLSSIDSLMSSDISKKDLNKAINEKIKYAETYIDRLYKNLEQAPSEQRPEILNKIRTSKTEVGRLKEYQEIITNPPSPVTYQAKQYGFDKQISELMPLLKGQGFKEWGSEGDILAKLINKQGMLKSEPESGIGKVSNLIEKLSNASIGIKDRETGTFNKELINLAMDEMRNIMSKDLSNLGNAFSKFYESKKQYYSKDEVPKGYEQEINNVLSRISRNTPTGVLNESIIGNLQRALLNPFTGRSESGLTNRDVMVNLDSIMQKFSNTFQNIQKLTSPSLYENKQVLIKSFDENIKNVEDALKSIRTRKATIEKDESIKPQEKQIYISDLDRKEKGLIESLGELKAYRQEISTGAYLKKTEYPHIYPKQPDIDIKQKLGEQLTPLENYGKTMADAIRESTVLSKQMMAKMKPDEQSVYESISARGIGNLTERLTRTYAYDRYSSIQSKLLDELKLSGGDESRTRAIRSQLTEIDYTKLGLSSESTGRLFQSLQQFISKHSQVVETGGMDFSYMSNFGGGLRTFQKRYADVMGKIGQDIQRNISQLDSMINMSQSENIIKTDLEEKLQTYKEELKNLRKQASQAVGPEKERLLSSASLIETKIKDTERLGTILQSPERMTMRDQLRYRFTQPLGESLSNFGRMNATNFSVAMMFGMSSAFFEALTRIPQQASLMGSQPYYTAMGGLMGVTPMFNELMSFSSEIPNLINLVQTSLNSMQALLGSSTQSKSAIDTALRISRTQPIQFPEALQVLTALSTYPETRPYAADRGFQEKSFKTIQYLSMLAPEQGVGGALFAVRELLGNQFRSLERRFNISPELLAGIAGVSVEKFKSAPGAEKIDILFKSLSRLFGGEDILFKKGGQLDVQLKNISDVLVNSLIRPMTSEMSPVARGRVEKMFDEGSLAKIIPDQFKELMRLSGKKAQDLYGLKPGTEEYKAKTTELARSTATQMWGTPAGYLSLVAASISESISKVFDNLNLGTAIGDFAVSLTGKMTKDIQKFNEDILNAGSAQEGKGIAKDFIKTLMKDFKEAFNESTGKIGSSGLQDVIMGTVDVIKEGLSTAMKSSFKAVLTETVKIATELPQEVTRMGLSGIGGLLTSSSPGSFGEKATDFLSRGAGAMSWLALSKIHTSSPKTVFKEALLWSSLSMGFSDLSKVFKSGNLDLNSVIGPATQIVASGAFAFGKESQLLSKIAERFKKPFTSEGIFGKFFTKEIPEEAGSAGKLFIRRISAKEESSIAKGLVEGAGIGLAAKLSGMFKSLPDIFKKFGTKGFLGGTLGAIGLGLGIKGSFDEYDKLKKEYEQAIKSKDTYEIELASKNMNAFKYRQLGGLGIGIFGAAVGSIFGPGGTVAGAAMGYEFGQYIVGKLFPSARDQKLTTMNKYRELSREQGMYGLPSSIDEEIQRRVMAKTDILSKTYKVPMDIIKPMETTYKQMYRSPYFSSGNLMRMMDEAVGPKDVEKADLERYNKYKSMIRRRMIDMIPKMSELIGELQLPNTSDDRKEYIKEKITKYLSEEIKKVYEAIHKIKPEFKPEQAQSMVVESLMGKGGVPEYYKYMRDINKYTQQTEPNIVAKIYKQMFEEPYKIAPKPQVSDPTTLSEWYRTQLQKQQANLLPSIKSFKQISPWAMAFGGISSDDYLKTIESMSKGIITKFKKNELPATDILQYMQAFPEMMMFGGMKDIGSIVNKAYNESKQRVTENVKILQDQKVQQIPSLDKSVFQEIIGSSAKTSVEKLKEEQKLPQANISISNATVNINA